jgi:chromosome segregation ATPase
LYVPAGTKSKKNVSTSRPSTGVLGDAEFTSKVEQLLLEAKAENQALEDQLRVTRDHLLSSEREVDRAHKKLQNVESSKQEELLRLRAQLDTEHERHKKKKQVSDNIQLIKLQRESRRTSSWLATLESQRGTLQESLNSANETVLQLESQLASLQDELREGQQKNLGLQKDLETCESQLSRLKELEASVDGLQDENRILKQTNESLLQRTLSTERFQGASTSSSGVNLDELRDLRSQLTQAETTLKIELKMKADAVHALAQEKMKSGQNERLVRDLREKVDKLERDGRIAQSTVTAVQSSSQLEAQDGSLLKKQINDLETELGQTQWQLVQVRDELDKTRSLLRTQMTINKEGQKEIEVLTQKLDRSESTHHEKLQEFMRILEQRAEQMSFLEKTLETIHFKGNSSSMAAAPTDQTGSTSTPPPPRIVTINLDDDTTLRNKITEESGKGGQ